MVAEHPLDLLVFGKENAQSQSQGVACLCDPAMRDGCPWATRVAQQVDHPFGLEGFNLGWDVRDGETPHLNRLACCRDGNPARSQSLVGLRALVLPYIEVLHPVQLALDGCSRFSEAREVAD